MASSFALGSLSYVLWLAAMPPVDIWISGWLAPLPWLVLTSQERMSGRSMIGAWLAAVLFLAIHYSWMAHVHPAAIGLLAATSLIAGAGFPLTLWLSWRLSCRRSRALLWTAPAAATAVECVLDWIWPGFSTAALGLSQSSFPPALRIAAAVGLHGLGFFMVLTAAGVYLAVSNRRPGPAWFAMGAVAGCWALGSFFIPETPADDALHVVVVQSAVDRKAKGDPAQEEPIVADYIAATRHAQAAGGGDLFIWPETAIGPGVDIGQVARKLADNIQGPPPMVLAGAERIVARNGQPCKLNSAVWLAAETVAAAPYDKMALVPFAEALPWADRIPWPDWARALSFNRCAGVERRSFIINGVRIVPAICFEAGLQPSIAREVQALRARGSPPGLIVILGNLNWFRGPRPMELFLATAIFRAVENHLPVVVAANGGRSAIIDSRGRIRAEAKTPGWQAVHGRTGQRFDHGDPEKNP